MAATPLHRRACFLIQPMVLVSQAGVASAEPIRTGRIFVDERSPDGLSVVNLSR
jgi:hypothetical protein